MPLNDVICLWACIWNVLLEVIWCNHDMNDDYGLSMHMMMNDSMYDDNEYWITAWNAAMYYICSDWWILLSALRWIEAWDLKACNC